MKEHILLLRSKGYSYNQIVKELGCSKSLVAYYCGFDQKLKNKIRTRKRRSKAHPFQKKMETFKHRKKRIKSRSEIHKTKLRKRLYEKIRAFHRRYNKSMKDKTNFTLQDVINKFVETPICYLTGVEIDIYDTRSYEFDHIIPASRGGTNELDNLGICTKAANQAKGNMTPDEFVNLCKQVVNSYHAC